MVVRNVSMADAPELYALVCEYKRRELPRAVFDEYLAEALAKPGRRIVMAYEQNEPAGFADAEVRPSLSECAAVGIVRDFFVREPFRRRRIGTGMLLNLTTYFKTAGCVQITAACARVNLASQEFLEHRGFSKSQHAFVRTMEE